MSVPSPRRPVAVQERSFHTWLARSLPAGRRGILPLGDDAAALAPPGGRLAVLTTDGLVEGTHFLRASPPDLIGRAAAAVSLSDAAAKGATPAALLLALLLPRGTPSAWAQAVALGADRMGREFGAPLVGGDTKPAPVRAVVGTVLAWGTRGSLAPRTAARSGDVLVTTGTVGRGGWAAERWRAARRSPNLRRRTLRDLLDVRPRVAEGIALAPRVHAMLDTSDGIAEATRLLASASGVRIIVDAGRLPLAHGLRNLPPLSRWRAALYGGDYELLATLPARSAAAATGAVERTGGRLTAIGRVEPGAGAWLEEHGRRRPMPAAGWRPFAAPSRATRAA